MNLGLITETEYLHARDTYEGWCVVCEEFTRDATEPDAERYDCPCCGAPDSVYGAETALILGMFDGGYPYEPPAPPAPPAPPYNRDEWAGLGDFGRLETYQRDEDEGWGYVPIEPGESASYGDFRADESGDWLLPPHCSYGDYGGSLVEKSNVDYLLETYPEEIAELYGGYGSRGVAVYLPVATKELRETLCALTEYPLIDEERHSALEMEAQDDAWNDWGRDDFRRALERRVASILEEDETETEDDRFPCAADLAETLIGAIGNDALDTLFHTAQGFANEYWVNESGEACYIDVAAVVAKGGSKDWKDRQSYPISLEEVCEAVYMPHCFLARFTEGWRIVDNREPIAFVSPKERYAFNGAPDTETETETEET